ncbi:peptide ABC transporter substrate-binding protein [Baia soyae]|uniref:Oligopeptide transport system substrate-binding protein n=1 Tax=Baia soyae TaxID=1544746 RepID=A0A4R2S0A2_9BACL|nr:peptide ABC transporter substrate-binding protein [Baia soyae]TCP69259.1 oligopeptide transport system substrate-binding protein [Baia soyae]
MKKRKLVPFLAVTLVASLGVTACSFGGDKGAKDKGTLVVTDRAEPPNLDSAISSDSASRNVLANTQEGLYRHSKDGKSIEPALAEGEPKISPDKLTYTFKLRDSKWSDGKPVTAKDFEFAWKRALAPETASEYAFILHALKNGKGYNENKGKKAEEVGVKALDDKTLEVKLERVTPYFLDLVAFPNYLPQREDIVKQHGGKAGKFAKEANTNVYSGPFKLTEWKHEQSYTMEKNDQYWDAKSVKLNKVVTKVMKDSSATINAYNTNQVQVTLLGTDYIPKYKDKKEAVSVAEGSSWYLEMNQKNKLLQNKKIRQALNLALDKKEFQSNVLQDKSVPAGGLVPPEIKANGNDANKLYREAFPEEPKFDATKAKGLFEEGLKELKLSQAPVLEMVTDDTTAAKRHGEYVKDAYKKNLGLEIKVSSVPFKQRLERGKKGEFDLLASGWHADYSDSLSFIDLFETGAPYNRGKWSNKEYDELVKKIRENTTGNVEDRLQNQRKAEQILLEDAGIVPEYYRSVYYMVKPEVKDMVFNSAGFGEEYSFKWAYIE